MQNLPEQAERDLQDTERFISFDMEADVETIRQLAEAHREMMKLWRCHIAFGTNLECTEDRAHRFCRAINAVAQGGSDDEG